MTELLLITGIPFGLFCLAGIACGVWRWRMMWKHPERYEKFRQLEKEFEEDRRQILTRQGKAAGKIAEAGISAAQRFLKR